MYCTSLLVSPPPTQKTITPGKLYKPWSAPVLRRAAAAKQGRHSTAKASRNFPNHGRGKQMGDSQDKRQQMMPETTKRWCLFLLYDNTKNHKHNNTTRAIYVPLKKIDSSAFFAGWLLHPEQRKSSSGSVTLVLHCLILGALTDSTSRDTSLFDMDMPAASELVALVVGRAGRSGQGPVEN